MNLPDGYERDEVVRIEANLDDLSPEITGVTVERLLAAGALDVWLTPIQMKKNRPGVLLSVLSEEDTAARLSDLIFTETSTFGVRIERLIRLKLERRFREVQTPFGAVTVKEGLRRGEVIQHAPEFESCRQAAERAGVAVRVVYAAALLAAKSA